MYWKRTENSLALCGTIAAALLSAAGGAAAQESIATSDGLIELRASMPPETRVGEEFTYKIEVRNTSENVTLHDIQLKQQQAEGFSVESAHVGETDNQQQKKQEQKDQQQEKQQQAKDKPGSAKEKPAQQAQQKTSADSMRIAKLAPGQSKTITIKASADQEGQLKSCLEITSYRPAICLTSRVVKPELEITKKAPDRVGRCEVIELHYAVKNGGSGDVEAFQVIDELGEGLMTIEGEKKLQFQVDGLRAGDTREFVARVFATEPGTYSSRAMAKAQNSDLKSRSGKTTTEVVAADLDVRVKGPGRLYGDQLAQFTAHITNTGNFTAEDVQVHVQWPARAALADMDDVSLTVQSQGEKGQFQSKEDQPTEVALPRESNNRSEPQRDREQTEMDSTEFRIARLEPGQTAAFNYAIRPMDMDKVPTQVKAVYVCAIDEARDSDQAKSTSEATANAIATIAKLPALQMVVLDDEDPVPNGTQVTYRIRIWNEGDAADQQVGLTAELPKGLEFAKADGPSEHQVNGQKITFQPIDTLEPGDRLDYRVMAKSMGNGDVRFTAKLSSESLDQDVVGEEPTRLFSSQARN